ncbi:MAG: L-rhamnose isomerase [Oscillospiraceae bacterium]|jgi:L-rhamnose isomerase|nr:L-rhamnose isomerase [Oscillospiraceae bacterium]
MSDRYESAKAIYAEYGVDTEAAIAALQKIAVSLHCWQGDDVKGFEPHEGGLSGGIAATGNYPGAATNKEQLFEMLDRTLAGMPGAHKINVHAIYITNWEGKAPDRDALEPAHFADWVTYAKERGLGLDINPTFFSHPKAADGMTLSHPDKAVRDFWIAHAKCIRKIGAAWGKELGQPCVNNIWIPDGLKDVPGDRIGPRARLKESLDEILSEKYDPAYLIDTVESKVFGLGLESYTVGSHEFYMNYAAKNGILCLLDNGHFHPTEVVSDKISSMLLFADKIALHLTRGVRWDSDHVAIFDDELREICKEIVRCDALDRVIIALDYFDASIDRVTAWRVGLRAVRWALLNALLLPHGKMKQLQDANDFGPLLDLQEQCKLMPLGDVWAELLRR